MERLKRGKAESREGPWLGDVTRGSGVWDRTPQWSSRVFGEHQTQGFARPDQFLGSSVLRTLGEESARPCRGGSPELDREAKGTGFWVGGW